MKARLVRAFFFSMHLVSSSH